MNIFFLFSLDGAISRAHEATVASARVCCLRRECELSSMTMTMKHYYLGACALTLQVDVFCTDIEVPPQKELHKLQKELASSPSGDNFPTFFFPRLHGS
jgi:hypothetical protein